MPSEAVNIWCDEMVEGTITFEGGTRVPCTVTQVEPRFGGEVVEISESERPHPAVVGFVSQILEDAARNCAGIVVYTDPHYEAELRHREYLQQRRWACAGRYYSKPWSRFQSGEANLPLDLRDSTPDP